MKELDYPPVFKSRTTSTILDKVTLYVNEDQMLDGWTHPKGFYAVNPDPENDDYKKIKWSLGNAPTSGGEVRVDGYGDRPPFFNYTPPLNFSGKDYFSLLILFEYFTIFLLLLLPDSSWRTQPMSIIF